MKRSIGLAIATDPLGPFVKCPLNPVLNSEDGINFHIAAISTMLPYATGFYDPNAFIDTEDAQGVTWGLCHVAVGKKATHHTELLRFDCDLSTAINTPAMKNTMVNYSKEELLMHGLSKDLYMKRIGH